MCKASKNSTNTWDEEERKGVHQIAGENLQGIGIPTGKLDMYVAAAGINPQRVCFSYTSSTPSLHPMVVYPTWFQSVVAIVLIVYRIACIQIVLSSHVGLLPSNVLSEGWIIAHLFSLTLGDFKFCPNFKIFQKFFITITSIITS